MLTDDAFEELMMGRSAEEDSPASEAAQAIRENSLARFKTACESGLDLDEKDWTGASWVNQALQSEAFEIADWLIENGADPLSKDAVERDGLLNALEARANESAAMSVLERLTAQGPLGHELASRYALAALSQGKEELTRRAWAAGPVDVDRFARPHASECSAISEDPWSAQGPLSVLSFTANKGSLALFKAALALSQRPQGQPGSDIAPKTVVGDRDWSALGRALANDDAAKTAALLERAREIGPQTLSETLASARWEEAPRSRDHAIGLELLSGEPSTKRLSRQEAVERVRAARSVQETLDLAARFLGADRCAWGDELKGSDQALSFWRRCFFWVAAGDSGSSGSYAQGARAPFNGAETKERSLACAKALLAALLSPVGLDADPVLKMAGIKGRWAFFKDAPNDLALSNDDKRRLAYDPFDETVERRPAERAKTWGQLESKARWGGVEADKNENPASASSLGVSLENIQAFSDQFGLGGVRVCARGAWGVGAAAIEREMEAFRVMAGKLPIAPDRIGFGALQLTPGIPVSEWLGYQGRVMRQLPVLTSSVLMEREGLERRCAVIAHEYGHILDFWTQENPDSQPAAAMQELKIALAASPRSEPSARLWAEKEWEAAIKKAALAQGVPAAEMASFSTAARRMAELVRTQAPELDADAKWFVSEHQLLGPHQIFKRRSELLARRPDLNVFRQAANERDRESGSKHRYESKITEMVARVCEALFSEPDADRFPTGPEMQRAEDHLTRVFKAFGQHQESRLSQGIAAELSLSVAQKLKSSRSPQGRIEQRGSKERVPLGKP